MLTLKVKVKRDGRFTYEIYGRFTGYEILLLKAILERYVQNELKGWLDEMLEISVDTPSIYS